MACFERKRRNYNFFHFLKQVVKRNFLSSLVHQVRHLKNSDMVALVGHRRADDRYNFNLRNENGLFGYNLIKCAAFLGVSCLLVADFS